MILLGLDFADTVAPLVEGLLDEAYRLAGGACVYSVKDEIRAALNPITAVETGMGVFLRVIPKGYGAQVRLDKITTYKRPPRRLDEQSYPAILADIPLWHAEVSETSSNRKGMARNPKWTREEIILAMQQYFDTPPWTINGTHPVIIHLSQELNQLAAYDNAPDKVRYRNPNGVYMKLMNLQRLDPSRDGRGLKGGGRREAEIWDEYAHNLPKLRDAANTIRAAMALNSSTVSPETPDVDPNIEFAEGRLVTTTHLRRERHPETRKALLDDRRQRGLVRCEICEWKPPQLTGFENAGLEAHHVEPLALALQPRKTKVQDLALLCANCHRLAHRAISLEKRWLNLPELRSCFGA